MSKTEELRAELDRLKIKWWEDDFDSSHRTVFDGANGVRYCAYEFCGILYLMTRLPVTVEQAIAVTVGERNPDGLPIGLTISNDGNLLNWIGENYVRQDAAKVGAGTCHYVPDETGFTWWDENDVEHYEEDSASEDCGSASCDKCGNQMMVGDEGWFDGWDKITEWREEDGSYHKGYVLEPIFEYCPNCGRRCVGLNREGKDNGMGQG